MYQLGEFLKTLPETAVWAAIAIAAVIELYKYVQYRWPKTQTKQNPRMFLAVIFIAVVLRFVSLTGVGKASSTSLQPLPTVEAEPLAADDAIGPGNKLETTAIQLKAFVKQTQIWETLTLYSAPWNCDARELDRYWKPGSKAFLDVGESASRLNERGWHYGFGSRLLSFEFRYVRISQDGLSAQVGTREHWWLPLYARDGTPVANRNPDLGPYEIDYLLTKTNGRWYLKATSTPYTLWKPRQMTCKNWPIQTNELADTNVEFDRGSKTLE